MVYKTIFKNENNGTIRCGTIEESLKFDRMVAFNFNLQIGLLPWKYIPENANLDLK